AIDGYVGVDFSPELLAAAIASTAGDFHERDLSRPGCLASLPSFAAITCLATLQHLPGRANRLALLREMGEHLSTGGRLILSTWQFRDSPRQQSKLLDWSTVGLAAEQVEANDYLVAWRRGRYAVRYVALIDQAETAALAAAAGLVVLKMFFSDGKEGNLNLYSILGRARQRGEDAAQGDE
ncbi:MAG: class I SAM-dependent methyltransferase, partial [Chloroflexota bacterium]